MSEVTQDIRMVPISAVNVLNPRARNKKVFNELVTRPANQRPPSKKVTADVLVRSYRKEAERQRLRFTQFRYEAWR